jgi:Skp family chaperone for outer membrane proteins
MRIQGGSVLAAAVLALSAGMGWSADVKIAVVDMARLVRAHGDTAPADAMLEKQMDEFRDEQKDMEVQYEKVKKTFDDARKEATDKALSEEAREGKMQVAEKKLTDVRDYERKIRETLSARQKQISDDSLRLRKRIVGKIREAVQEYAAKKGYTLVLDTAALSVSGVEIVLYSSDKVDITDDMLKIIGKSKASVTKASDTKVPEDKE